MDTIRKIIIFSVFIVLGFVAAVLRMWVLDHRKSSLKNDFKYSLIVVIIFAVIAAVIIYINN